MEEKLIRMIRAACDFFQGRAMGVAFDVSARVTHSMSAAFATRDTAMPNWDTSIFQPTNPPNGRETHTNLPHSLDQPCKFVATPLRALPSSQIPTLMIHADEI